MSSPDGSDASAPDSPLIAAHRAFERGDFFETRKLAAALERDAPDEPTRAAARSLLSRLSVDPVVVALTAGCALFFFAVVALSLAAGR